MAALPHETRLRSRPSLAPFALRAVAPSSRARSMAAISRSRERKAARTRKSQALCVELLRLCLCLIA